MNIADNPPLPSSEPPFLGTFSVSEIIAKVTICAIHDYCEYNFICVSVLIIEMYVNELDVKMVPGLVDRTRHKICQYDKGTNENITRMFIYYFNSRKPRLA